MPQLLLVLSALISLASADWELVVSMGDHVELLGPAGETVASQGRGLSSHMDSLALDPLTGYLYISDSNHPNTSIFSLRLDPPGHLRPPRDPPLPSPKPLVNRGSKLVQGVAFDPVERAIYWTTGNERRIMRVVVGGLRRQARSAGVSASNMEVVHHFPEEIPHGIAVDSCRRQLYWTNCNTGSPTIERSALSGAGREVVVREDLFQPVGVTLSQGDGWLYWADERSASVFRIERVSVDGSQRQLLVRSNHQQPFSLAIIPGVSLFWTDLLQQALWKIPLNSTDLAFPVEKPILVRQYPESSTPKGLVSFSQDINLDSEQCQDLIQLRNQLGGWNSEPEPCPKSFCLNGGTCSSSSAGPVCRCEMGFLGNRCQLTARMCSAFCLDVVSLVSEPDLSTLCRCEDSEGSVDDALQRLRRDPALGLKLATLSLSLVVCLLLAVIVFLVWKTCSLSKRPKLRRRYTLNKKPPMAGVAPAHCEIEIENCCNMNICETPCYEPELRSHKGAASKKEEKRSLIDNLHESLPSSPPF